MGEPTRRSNDRSSAPPDTNGRAGHDGEGSDDPPEPTDPGGGARSAIGRAQLSRRSFLGMTGALAATAVVPACTDRGAATAPGVGVPEGSAAVPQTGLQVPEAQSPMRFLNPHQVALVEAIAARIIPGDEDDPGAVEAGSVDFIDRMLAAHEGFARRTYTDGPFARTYTGDEPEPEDGVIWVHEDEIERYGWQSGFTPRQLYEMGLARLDALSEQRHGGSFVDLDEGEQDDLLLALEEDEDDDVAEVFDPIGASTFFDLVRRNVIEGFLADPMYGGNRDLVGWQLVGFPGAQRAYSPEELLDPDFQRPPQSLAQLAMLHGDHGDPDALLSVRRRHPRGPID